MTDFKQLQDIANRLRVNSIKATNASNSGHPTSCASMAEIMSVLFFDTMNYCVSDPKNNANDRFVLSKGHAAPILYAAWAEAGLFPVEDLTNLRKIDSDLEGHPTPRLNFVDVASGSLGQGINCAAGMAWVGKKLDKADYNVYCVLGDGESAEGSVWEAMSFASAHKLDNLFAIFDVNRQGQSEQAMLGHQMDVYEARCKAFGMETYNLDGHSVEALVAAFNQAKANKNGKPKAFLCKTYKGRGFPGIEDVDKWHGKPLGAKGEEIIAQLQSMMSTPKTTLKPKAPKALDTEKPDLSVKLSEPPSYDSDAKVATRQAYGFALRKLGRNSKRVVAFDGDTKNSTFAEMFANEFPERYGECYIAEQNMVGVGVGAACRDRAIVFVSTFAVFLSRAYDHLRMAAISQSNLNCVGSHCGVSIGEDGPSQMALEDLAMFRAIPTATIFYPSDAVATERAVELAAQTKGITFTRTSRPATAMVYPNDEKFEVGKAKVVCQHGNLDQVLVIGAGVTLHEALRAADVLAKEHQTHIRILDPFTIKPIDKEAILKNAKDTMMRVVVVEEHYPEGGVGEAVLSALAGQSAKFVHLAVREVPRSGPPQVLMEKYGISAKDIVAAVNKLVNN
jgi:transketolase